MKSESSFPFLLESFFTQRLISQRQVSPCTIASYSDTFRLLLDFAQKRLHKQPSCLALEDLEAPLITTFLEYLEKTRGNAARSRNLRLTAIRSFFNYAAYHVPAQSAQIQRVLAIPSKRETHTLVQFLKRPEIDALLDAPDQTKWGGRRDLAFLMVAMQTGLRLSEMTGLRRPDVHLGTGAYVHCLGKGRKERCTPLTKQSVKVLEAWLREPARKGSDFLFPNARGNRLSADGAEYLVAKHVTAARQKCPSLRQKRVSPHVLRHTAAMELRAAGVDPSTIALWLGHESVETTQIYMDADLALKEKALAKTVPISGKVGRYKPSDRLLTFLKSL
jgi:integrase/recombinase XerD